MLQPESVQKLAGTWETIRSEPREEYHIVYCFYTVPCDAPGSHNLSYSIPNVHPLPIPIQHHCNMQQNISATSVVILSELMTWLHYLISPIISILTIVDSELIYDVTIAPIYILEDLLVSQGTIYMANA